MHGKIDAVRTDPLVVVVDDDAPFREALRELFASVGLETILYGSTLDLLEAQPLERPGCLILDVRLPGPSGLDLQRQLADRGILTPIIFLTAYGDIPMTVEAMKGGAVDFLTKPARDQILLDAVGKAIQTDRQRRAASETARRNLALFKALTPRERQVMRSVVLGKLGKEIAADLGISEVTVKIHRSSMMRKMGQRTVPGLVRAWESLPNAVRETGT
jgi:FixJ family two-component response regulator